jgi:DnaJ-class molecular chaperone
MCNSQCNSCAGTGEDFNEGDPCNKCNNTGVVNSTVTSQQSIVQQYMQQEVAKEMSTFYKNFPLAK